MFSRENITKSLYLSISLLILFSCNAVFAENVAPLLNDPLFNHFKGELGEQVVRDFFGSEGWYIVDSKSGPHGIDLIATRPGSNKPLVIEVKTDGSQLNKYASKTIDASNQSYTQQSEIYVKSRADSVNDPKVKQLLKSGIYRARVVRVVIYPDYLEIFYNQVTNLSESEIELNDITSKTFKVPSTFITKNGGLKIPIIPQEGEPAVVTKFRNSLFKSTNRLLEDPYWREHLIKKLMLKNGAASSDVIYLVDQLLKDLKSNDPERVNFAWKQFVELVDGDLTKLYAYLRQLGMSPKAVNAELKLLNQLKARDPKAYERRLNNLSFRKNWKQVIANGISMSMFKNLGLVYRTVQGQEDWEHALQQVCTDALGYSASVKLVNGVIFQTGNKCGFLSWLPKMASQSGAEFIIAMTLFDDAKVTYSYLSGDLSRDQFVDMVENTTIQGLRTGTSYTLAHIFVSKAIIALGVTSGVGTPAVVGITILSEIGGACVIDATLSQLLSVCKGKLTKEILTLEDLEKLFGPEITRKCTPWNYTTEKITPWALLSKSQSWIIPDNTKETPWSVEGKPTPWE